MGALTARADARASPAARALDIIPCPLHHILAPTTPQPPCIGVWTRGVTVHGRACAQSSPRTGRLLRLTGRIEFTPHRGVQGCGSTPGVLSTPPHGDAVALRCSLVPCLQRLMTFTYWVHVVCPHQSKEPAAPVATANPFTAECDQSGKKSEQHTSLRGRAVWLKTLEATGTARPLPRHPRKSPDLAVWTFPKTMGA